MCTPLYNESAFLILPNSLSAPLLRVRVYLLSVCVGSLGWRCVLFSNFKFVGNKNAMYSFFKFNEGNKNFFEINDDFKSVNIQFE
jgi:hypothetical protein